MTTPNGNPAWTRSADHTFYGGDLNKRNYADLPIVNPQTDVGADHLQRMAADLASVALMADFAAMRITMSSGSSAPTVNSCRLMTGIYTGSGYSGTSPPTGFPSVSGVSDGIIDIKFTGAYSDAYSVSATFQPTFAEAFAEDTDYRAHAVTSGTDTVRVTVVTASGSAVASKSVAVRVA